MTFLAALTAALKAIPEIASAIRGLGQLYKDAQDAALKKKFDELREEVNVITKQIETAKTDDQRRDLAAQLANAISK